METKVLARKVFGIPESLTAKEFHYCPGCSYGVVHRVIGEVVDELGIHDKVIGVASVGCSVLIYDYFKFDFFEAAHGRAPASATGIKRVRPDSIVFTYQGDGDLASIGMAEIVHAANRGENITVIFTNNAVYGMTGGQMAPTTLPGMRTTTSPKGRDVKKMGYPVKMSELLANLDGVAYVERVSASNPKNIMLMKKAIKTAFLVQMHGLGFSMVEVLSACPTNWKMDPVDALNFVENEMSVYYPLGVFKMKEEVKNLR